MRKKAVYLILVMLGVSLILLVALRLYDEHADRMEWARLALLQPTNPAVYEPAIVANLPEPAQRFFNFAIEPGTPLLTVAEIDMDGEFSLGTRDNPNYRPMDARQILAAPMGFVWKVKLLEGSYLPSLIQFDQDCPHTHRFACPCRLLHSSTEHTS